MPPTDLLLQNPTLDQLLSAVVAGGGLAVVIDRVIPGWQERIPANVRPWLVPWLVALLNLVVMLTPIVLQHGPKELLSMRLNDFILLVAQAAASYLTHVGDVLLVNANKLKKLQLLKEGSTLMP
jgi:hypothetical protein